MACFQDVCRVRGNLLSETLSQLSPGGQGHKQVPVTSTVLLIRSQVDDSLNIWAELKLTDVQEPLFLRLIFVVVWLEYNLCALWLCGSVSGR